MNTPAPTNTCRQCGGPMASNAPEGLCARCLLSVAMKEPEASDGSDRSDKDGAANLPASDIPDIGDAAEVARRLPQFEILELLGRGGMGVVYKARQLNLDRIVALKILPPTDALTPDFVERFRREARSLAKLSHTNIVAVYDFGESGGLYYFVMEYVDGVNLRTMIRAGKMKPEEALAVVPKICDALQFAHEEGVVHRDIKPENILIDKRGRVKIADFGLAKLLRREQTDNTLTMSGMTLGTPRYMAPEQMDKPETVDHRADIYSLGVVFYEMLTGEVPMGRFAPPSERVQIDVRLDEIVLHALERDADRRYQHASQVREDVEKVTSKPLSAPVPKTDVPADGSSFVQKAGETFAMRIWPRDGTDWLLMHAASLIIGGLFMILPGLGAFLLCTAAGMSALQSTPFGIVAGLGVFFALFCTLVGSGSVQSVSVDRFGLTLNRLIGPSRFLPWSSIVQIQAMSRWDAVKTAIWPGFPPRASIFSGAYTHFYRIACFDDCWHFGPKEPEKFLEAVRRLRSPGVEKATDVPDAAAPTAPVESEAVRRARASWFGRRSERFRTLLPPILMFLELVFLLAGMGGWPAPWLHSMTTPGKHGAVSIAYEFRPFSFTFFLIVMGGVSAFLAVWFSRRDNLIRYGRHFREVRNEIRREAKRKILGGLAVTMVAPVLIAASWKLINESGRSRNATHVENSEFRLRPRSKAFDNLSIELPFYSNFVGGVEHFCRPNQWDLTIALKPNNGTVPVAMDIEMPSLRATYPWNPGDQYPLSVVLDLDELSKWMGTQGKLEVKTEPVKKEAGELMALLKKFSRQAPVTGSEFYAVRNDLMPDFGFAGYSDTGTYSAMHDGVIVIYLASTVVFMAFYFVLAMRIQRAAFALDSEVTKRGDSILALGPLPRVSFRNLPPDIRRRMIRRAGLAAAGLLALPAFAALWEFAPPKHTRQTYHYEFTSESKAYTAVTMSFAFERYERGGETWLVQPKTFQLNLAFTLPKNFASAPGSLDQHINPITGVPEGVTHSFNVELPGLRATFPRREGVTLDAEELEQWLRESFLPSASAQPEDTEIKRDAVELLAFLKQFATRAPDTLDVFLASARKIPGLRLTAETMGARETSGHDGSTTAMVAAASLLVFFAILPLLKKSVIRDSIRQGRLDDLKFEIGDCKEGAIRDSIRQGRGEVPEQASAAGDLNEAGNEVIVNGPAAATQPLPAEPHLSRLALWSAILIALFFLSLALILTTEIMSDMRGQGWHPFWQIPVVAFTVFPAVALMPFAATILAAMAIKKIKASHGKVYGLRLAAISVLFFPLIVEFLIVAGIVYPIASYILLARAARASSYLQSR